jgi:hypothetical protein
VRHAHLQRVDVPGGDLHESMMPLCLRRASISGLRPRNAT